VNQIFLYRKSISRNATHPQPYNLVQMESVAVQ